MLELAGNVQGETGLRGAMMALGGQGSRPAKGGEFGMDFAHLLRTAQDTGEREAPPSRPQKVESAGDEDQTAAPSEGSRQVDGKALEDAHEEKAEDAEAAAEEEETQDEAYVPLEQAAVAVELAAEFVPLNPETGERAPLEEDIILEGVAWKESSGQMRLGKGGESGKSTSEGFAVDELEGEAESSAEEVLPLLPAQEDATLEFRSSLDLLSAHELLDPDLVVEEIPAQFVERLQQAMGAGNAPVLADDAAQVVLPQVIRGLATLVRDGAAEMRLQLQPPDLGEIELRVRTTEATVRAEMMVQHPEIKQLLDGHMDRLRNALAAQGLELEGFDVNVEGDAHFAQGHGSWGREEGDRSRRLAGDRRPAPIPAVEAASVGVRRGDNAVDYTI